MNYESSTINSHSGKRTYTVKEISDILGIGRTAAYKLVHSGVFKTVQIGSTIRVSKQSFDEWLDRVSGGNEKLRQLIIDKKFLFGGRALANRGTGKKGSMFNCYSSGYAPDDINGLMQLNTNLALTYKAQGGQGLSLTNIRPKGTPIGNEFESDGIVPFMEIFNATTSSICS